MYLLRKYVAAMKFSSMMMHSQANFTQSSHHRMVFGRVQLDCLKLTNLGGLLVLVVYTAVVLQAQVPFSIMAVEGRVTVLSL